MKIPVIAIFDIGKTNKKLFLFNQQYQIVFEASEQLPETTDEDGFVCEDVQALTAWVQQSFHDVLAHKSFEIIAVNFSAYGASFVYIDKNGKVNAPLYNYLKPYPPKLHKQFYDTYGGESLVAKQTASPILGNLNSGMQLYRLKYEQPNVFNSIEFALHLPQYISYVLARKPCTDLTSIGCHTNLWNFQKNNYHYWVSNEGLDKKFAPVADADDVTSFTFDGKSFVAGYGLHDSSAALIPYLAAFQEPFILLSTGTWAISLNPFNHSQLTDLELHQDCLCFLAYNGKPVKASRLFAGYEHEQQTKKLAAHFGKPLNYFTTVLCDHQILNKLQPVKENTQAKEEGAMVQQSAFAQRDINRFKNYEEAYHQLIADIIVQQVKSTKLVLSGSPVKRLFVDGGFGKNSIYMYLLADAFPDIEVYAAAVAQASALGAALAIHQHWNSREIPGDLIELKFYSALQHNKI